MIKCGYRSQKSSTYLFYCEDTARFSHLLMIDNKGRELTPKEVLGTREGIYAFKKWAPRMGLYKWRMTEREPRIVDESERENNGI